jgi:uncharacterized SAM-binding protein YcdF (DUF218 family)
MPVAPRSYPGRFALAVILLVLVAWIVSAAEVYAASRRDEARPAQAIVVLGAAQYVGRPSPVLRARLDHALDLWHRQLAPRLIFTGGRGFGDTTSEAAVGRNYALRRGVPDSAILLENEGRTTSESMRAVAAMLHDRGAERVILVSDPFHMRRLSVIARSYGLEPYGSPTTTSPISARRPQWWKYMLSESVKVPMAYILERAHS